MSQAPYGQTSISYLIKEAPIFPPDDGKKEQQPMVGPEAIVQQTGIGTVVSERG